MRLLVLALAAALSGQGGRPAGPLIVVIDGDSAVAAPEDTARRRVALLEQLDPGAVAKYYELTASGIHPVAPTDAASFRRTVFTVTPPSYSGVKVTFSESTEILRGNEAVREAVIARECSSGCGGRVRAAVEAEVKRTEGESARKLQHLAAQATSWRGARVVLVTSGWPTRDEARVRLDRALAPLREHAVSLTVVHVPSREPYRGLVRDASESLAARLPARYATLAGDADVSAAATLVGVASPAQTTAAITTSAGASASFALGATPGPESPAQAVGPSTSPAADPPVAAPANDDATLRRAAAYVARFERTFTEVVWHERYEQEVRVWQRFSSSGETRWNLDGRRTLESELYFAWLPKDGTWIAVRDVMAVDGKARPAGDRRLAALAARGSVSVLELRELARENGRFNIGTIVRTFNEPTLALLFLTERHRARVAWSRKGQRRADGRVVATYAFTEQGRPTLIRSGDRDMPVRGTFDLDSATGEVLASTIELSEPLAIGEALPTLTGRMAVDYRPHVAFDVLVPGEMRESYSAHRSEEVTATAIYSDFRRFWTTARLILTP